MTADRPAPRKKPAMNNPYATQTQIEARIAARLNNPDKLRRALRLDNPHMWGPDPVDIYTPNRRHELPTPTYQAMA